MLNVEGGRERGREGGREGGREREREGEGGREEGRGREDLTTAAYAQWCKIASNGATLHNQNNKWVCNCNPL